MDLRFLLLLGLALTMVMASHSSSESESESSSESESESSEEEGTKYEVDEDEHIGANQKREEEEAEKKGKNYRSASGDAAKRQMQKYAWPGGKVIYRFHTSLTRMKSTIVTAMRALETILSKGGKKCITFEEKKSLTQRNYVEIISGDGCSADVGFQGGKQELSLGPGCYAKGTVWHELLHCLGFYHEQSRPDRDEFITIHSKYIKSGMENNFKKMLINRIDAFKDGYDIKSLMMYPPHAFTSIAGKKTIENKKNPRDTSFGQRLRLSPGDILAIRKLYDCDVEDPCRAMRCKVGYHCEHGICCPDKRPTPGTRKPPYTRATRTTPRRMPRPTTTKRPAPTARPRPSYAPRTARPTAPRRTYPPRTRPTPKPRGTTPKKRVYRPYVRS